MSERDAIAHGSIRQLFGVSKPIEINLSHTRLFATIENQEPQEIAGIELIGNNGIVLLSGVRGVTETLNRDLVKITLVRDEDG